MAKSAETLQAVLNNCDCKLDSILTQLESTGSKLDETFSQEPPNPVQLIRQIKGIREKLLSAKERFAELEDLKNEIREELSKELDVLKGQTDSIVK